MKADFPKGLDYNIGYNPTEFIAQSVSELIKTIYEAMLLVVIVVLVFLQGWRPAIIPIIAIPVSLVGTFAVMAALGFSINNLTLFGLVLAVGIVVDDAIVVVENVERHLEHGMSRRDAALRTMEEVGSALVSIALVLCAVFVPTAFLGGISGQFFQQFAVTIAVATAISCFCSLTLSPALASMILQPHADKRPPASWNFIGRGWDWLYRRLQPRLRPAVARLRQRRGLRHPAFGGHAAALCGADRQRRMAALRPRRRASSRRRIAATSSFPCSCRARRRWRAPPKWSARSKRSRSIRPGIIRVAAFAGFSGATRTQAGNAAALFPVFEEPEVRHKKGLSANAIANDLRKRLSALQGAFIIVIPPPAVPGIGTGGGFTMRIQDRQGRGPEMLAAATDELVGGGAQGARADPGVFALHRQHAAAVRRYRSRQGAETRRSDRRTSPTRSRPISARPMSTTSTCSAAPTTSPRRPTCRSARRQSDLARLRTRNAAGDMVPLGSVVDFRDVSGPDRVARYNLYPASELQGDTLPGTSSATAIDTMKRLAEETLPSGFSFEWTDLSYQQVTGGNAGLYVFPICVLFVFLVLAAQYGSWSLPFAVILIVPMCLLAATIGVRIMGQDVNILTQIGFVVLVGLAAKNAILIVEFARDIELEGRPRLEAVIEACRLRLRPILMTSFAFILGVLPLVISSGSGSEMRQAVGVAVFFGMIGVTLFGLIFTPIFYVIVRNLADRQEAPASVIQPRIGCARSRNHRADGCREFSWPSPPRARARAG